MIVLHVEPFSSLDNLGGDLCVMGVEVFLLHLVCHPLGDVFLRGRAVEDLQAMLW